MAEKSTQSRNRMEETGGESRGVERRQGSSILRRDPFDFPDLFPASPFGIMRRFAENMDRMFQGGSSSQWEGQGMWSPAIDVSEREGKLVVHADLPGMNKDDVKIEVVENALIIQGERKNEREEQERGYRRIERQYGSFYRAIPLPEGAQTEEARAEFKDGVLEVSVPVPANKRQGRVIPIEGSSERKGAGSEVSGQNRETKFG